MFPEPENGPREKFTAFVEWVLVNNNSAFTIGQAEDTRPTSGPEPSQPLHWTEWLPLPTTDTKREPAMDNEPVHQDELHLCQSQWQYP